MFRVIPVIDLMQGLVVAARGGNREGYQPLECRLCKAADPKNVVEGLLKLHDFQTLYVADLDAILGKPPQLQTLHSLQDSFPQLEFWIDGGMRSLSDCEDLIGRFRCQIIVGSETYSDVKQRPLPDEMIL